MVPFLFAGTATSAGYLPAALRHGNVVPKFTTRAAGASAGGVIGPDYASPRKAPRIRGIGLHRGLLRLTGAGPNPKGRARRPLAGEGLGGARYHESEAPFVERRSRDLRRRRQRRPPPGL